MPQIGPEVPPIRLVITIPTFFRKVAESVRSSPSQLGEHDLEAAGQRVAEVAVADDGVEVAEVLLVVDAVWAIVRTTNSTRPRAVGHARSSLGAPVPARQVARGREGHESPAVRRAAGCEHLDRLAARVAELSHDERAPVKSSSRV